jgi:hypothetical protein
MNEQIASSFWDCRRRNAQQVAGPAGRQDPLDMIALAFGRAMPSLRISEKQGSSFT